MGIFVDCNKCKNLKFDERNGEQDCSVLFNTTLSNYHQCSKFVPKLVKSKNYSLCTENGTWLGQVVLTEDGMFASVTDYGNLSYAWRSFGKEDFRRFILSLNTEYFARNMSSGLAYIVYSRKVEKACQRYAEMILPALKKALQEDLKENPNW